MSGEFMRKAGRLEVQSPVEEWQAMVDGERRVDLSSKTWMGLSGDLLV
jgi:hypothetical protein